MGKIKMTGKKFDGEMKMKKYLLRVVVLLVVVFLFSLVLAQGGNNSNSSGGNSSVSNFSAVNKTGELKDLKTDSSYEYTSSFYFAIIVGVVGLVIVGYFVYAFFRRPKDRWEK